MFLGGREEIMGFFDLFKRQKPVDLVALQRDLEIVNDCAQLIENTVNPETFFSRYDLYMEKLAVLAEAQASHRVKVKGDNLIQKYERMNTDEQKAETINAFIDRMWYDTCQKADKLKTEKGKENRYKKLFDTMSQYEGAMPDICIRHYKHLVPIKIYSEEICEQILRQKDSIKKNGFSHYEYIACSNSCPKCKALDGKIFPLSQLRPGLNAPPMCEHCRCSISAHTGESEEDYQNWLNSF